MESGQTPLVVGASAGAIEALQVMAARRPGHPATASRYDRTGADAAQVGDLIRELLRRLEPGPVNP